MSAAVTPALPVVSIVIVPENGVTVGGNGGKIGGGLDVNVPETSNVLALMADEKTIAEANTTLANAAAENSLGLMVAPMNAVQRRIEARQFYVGKA